MYREYLDPAYLADFDAWRNKYKNPFRDLQKKDGGRVRNWDDERRFADEESDGVVAEVVFPNTVPPFFPSFILFARPPKPDEYEHRLAGIRAHNRWLADWCGRFPNRRAGIGQIFLNNVDDAIDDVRWINEHGLRGGVLVTAIPPDVDWVKPLYDPHYDRLWAECEKLGLPVNAHGGTGVPDYGKYPVADLLYINEAQFYSQRPFVQIMLSGVFERFPNLKFVMTEMGCAWIPPMLRRMDAVFAQIRKTGRTGELRYSEEHILPEVGVGVLRAELLGRCEPARPGRCGRAPSDRARPVHVGERLPAPRGHVPLHARAPAPALPRHRSRRAPATARGQRGEAVRLRPRRARADRGQGRTDARRDRATARDASRAPERSAPKSFRALGAERQPALPRKLRKRVCSSASGAGSIFGP